MASAFKISPTMTGYNLDRCEEIILVAAFLVVKDNLPRAEPWMTEFEAIFFNSDKGVSEGVIDNINSALKRIKRSSLTIKFKPSVLSPYMRMRGIPKRESRLAIADELRNPATVARLLGQAKDDIDKLIAPQDDVEPVFVPRVPQSSDPAIPESNPSSMVGLSERVSVQAPENETMVTTMSGVKNAAPQTQSLSSPHEKTSAFDLSADDAPAPRPVSDLGSEAEPPVLSDAARHQSLEVQQPSNSATLSPPGNIRNSQAVQPMPSPQPQFPPPRTIDPAQAPQPSVDVTDWYAPKPHDDHISPEDPKATTISPDYRVAGAPSMPPAPLSGPRPQPGNGFAAPPPLSPFEQALLERFDTLIGVLQRIEHKLDHADGQDVGKEEKRHQRPLQ